MSPCTLYICVTTIFFFNDTAPTEIYTLSLHDALPMAAEEAERLGHKHVGTEHLLLGILREEKCFGAEILMERGLRLSTLREELARTSGEKTAARPKETSLLAEFSRDLTQAASEGSL